MSILEKPVKTARAGSLGNVCKNLRSLIEVELEMARVKEDLDTVRMERDILKKAAAYFAKESLPVRNLPDHEFMTDASNQI